MIMINQINMLDNNIINCVQIEVGATPDEMERQIFVMVFLTKVISYVAMSSVLVKDFLI